MILSWWEKVLGWTSLWAVKSILRGFEMISRLRINMWKRKMYGIGIRDQFLQSTSYFLSCKINSIPLNFLGIMVGVNLRKYQDQNFE